MPEFPYNRIVSLVPSLTELLINFGLTKQLIGRTRFCIHPEEKVKKIDIIGGTKNPDLEKIIGLKPDFILANKEENRKEDIEVLEKYTDVRVTDINTIQDAIIEISALGDTLGAKEKSESLIHSITTLLDQKPASSPLSVAYLIWKDPWMTIGKDTYIHDVLREYNLHNVFADQNRYPKISMSDLSAKQPDLILLSSEPYPYKKKHQQEIQTGFPNTKVELANGEYFSWYGSRMFEAFGFLNAWRQTL